LTGRSPLHDVHRNDQFELVAHDASTMAVVSEQESSWWDRPSFVRDVIVQAVGSAIGVGLIGVTAIAFGFVSTPHSEAPLVTAAGMTMMFAFTAVFAVSLAKADQSRGKKRRVYATIMLITLVCLVLSFWWVISSNRVR
jgi:hypothetical protein